MPLFAADPRPVAVFLGGSLGLGGGDAWSDVDLILVVEAADHAAVAGAFLPRARALASDWPEALEAVVRANLDCELGVRFPRSACNVSAAPRGTSGA